MIKRMQELELMCDLIIDRINSGIENYKNNIPDDLGPQTLNQIKTEVQSMKRSLHDLTILDFTPSYEKVVTDQPDRHGLIKKLIELSCDYQRLQRQYVIYKRKLGEQEEKDS